MADEIVDISRQHGSVDIHTSPSRKAHDRDMAYVDQISFTHWGEQPKVGIGHGFSISFVLGIFMAKN